MIRSLFRRKPKKENPMGKDFNLVEDESAQTPMEPNGAQNPLIKSPVLPPVNVPGGLPLGTQGESPAQPAPPAQDPSAPTVLSAVQTVTDPTQSNQTLAVDSFAQPVPPTPTQDAAGRALLDPATGQPLSQPTVGQSAVGQSAVGQSAVGQAAPPVAVAPAAPQAAPQQRIRPRTAHGGPALIRLNNVTKAYETPTGPFLALKEVDLSIGKGEFVAVVGKSGSGKSTMINMITGIDRPTDGEIHIADTPIHNLGEGPMAEWRGRNVGVIFQFFQLLPMLTCVENVMLPMDFCKMYKPGERRKRAIHLLDMVEMADQADKLPSEVSGGQQQRVAIARALSNDPPVIVADEPTGNLDSKTADAVFQMFERLINEGKTILMVTHDDELAQRVTRRITIADGVIVGEEQLR